MSEPEAPTRHAHQRDRDRIVHSTAFRRLVYKTQVFINHEGDLFRTRMTHSLEVAQLARSLARVLHLNEDLVEAISLAHDLGHTPFGHAGQDALNQCMKDHGGFEHNLQSLRVIDYLEERYPSFNGLNLTFEVREGVLKHCSRRNASIIEAAEPGGVAHRFLHGGQPSLEAQLCNLADEIAYSAHDVDDGVRSGLLSVQELEEAPLFQEYWEQVAQQYPSLKPRRRLFEAIRLMLSTQIYDVMDASRLALQQASLASVEDVRRCSEVLIQFSPKMRVKTNGLKQFLMRRLYRHPEVLDTMAKAQTVVDDLFHIYVNDVKEMPDDYALREDVFRAVSDYVAGMTDRFALKEHQRLTGRRVFDDVSSFGFND